MQDEDKPEVTDVNVDVAADDAGEGVTDPQVVAPVVDELTAAVAAGDTEESVIRTDEDTLVSFRFEESYAAGAHSGDDDEEPLAADLDLSTTSAGQFRGASTDVTPDELTLEGEDDEEEDLPNAFRLEGAALLAALESLIFVSDKPVLDRQLAKLVGSKLSNVRLALEELAQHYAERGINLVEVSGGFQFRTAMSTAVFVREFIGKKPVKLTRAQVETMAIVAYRQPVTRPEIDDIRGVDSGMALKVLSDRHLIKILGRKDEPGRPLLYGTTPQFLEFFGLSSLRDLPTLQEFSELSDESRGIFERRMGEPLDLKSIQSASVAAEVEAGHELFDEGDEDEPEDDEDDLGEDGDDSQEEAG